MTDNLEAAFEEINGEDGIIIADFSAAGEDFADPKPGRYPVKVESAKPDTSKSGNPVIKIQWVVTDGSHKGKLFSSLNYTGDAAWKLRKFLKALGFTVEGKTFSLNPADLVGKEGIGEVDKESAKFSSLSNLLPAAASSASGLE